MDDFRYNNIKISQTKLKSLQEKVSYIIFEFIFSNYYDAPYISEETGFGIPVGKYYYVPEYFLIRNLYFIGKNINSSDFLSIDAISNIFGLNKNMGDYMTTGCGLGVENLEKIENVIKDLNLNESYKILFEIERFKQSYFKRQEILSPLLGFSSYFQMNLHNFIEKYLNIKFSQDRPIQYITGSSYVCNNKEIQIPCGLHFDGYTGLDARFRDKIGLSHIWQGIAFEAHGTWHKDKKEFKERWGFTDEDWRQRQLTTSG
ncbi:MAG: hypothetical protein GF317_15775 [Candidatus Lokiarchaeota archaeon]|nr:hypothetical protein [Candidatus Lokiarchaeota archaeon]